MFLFLPFVIGVWHCSEGGLLLLFIVFLIHYTFSTAIYTTNYVHTIKYQVFSALFDYENKAYTLMVNTATNINKKREPQQIEHLKEHDLGNPGLGLIQAH